MISHPDGRVLESTVEQRRVFRDECRSLAGECSDLFGRDALSEFWPVAVVDRVVPSLEDVLEMRVHVLDGSSLRLVLVGPGELNVP